MSETHPDTSELGAQARPAIKPGLQFGLIVVAEIAAACAVLAGVQWWRHGRFVQTTNDAYLQADQVTVAPKLPGYVDQVLVADNQRVAAGQPLVRIDSSGYDAALAEQTAALDARRADLETLERQTVQQRAAVERARAEYAGARSESAFAAGEARRFNTLSAQGVETRQRAAQAQSDARRAQAQAQSDAAGVTQAQAQVATLQAQRQQALAQVEAAQAHLQTARLNLDDTLIRASVAGRVGDRAVRVGQYVQPGTRLMTVVPVQDIYLVANFKETQIDGIRVGQQARVRIDALGGVVVPAVVDSFAPGTGAQFALLPPENATGNFTKVVQRIPIRLRLQASGALRERMLPGLSATVQIDTTQPGPAARLASRS